MLIFNIIASLLAIGCLVCEFRRDLMMLQQNSYRNERYNRWLRASQDTTSVMRLVSGAVALASMSTLSIPTVSLAFVSVTATVNIILLEEKKYKKPLVMTRRVWRIFIVMLLLAAIIIATAAFWGTKSNHTGEYVSITALLIFCFSHIFVLIANWLLKPVEKHINKKYYHDAESILRAMPGLKIIGITGSYGKTSTKHYLNRILSEKYDVMMTPGSYNTTRLYAQSENI